MEVENDKCVICGHILDVNVVDETRLLKFIESSIERDDGKADYFRNRAEIKLHRNCRNTYINHMSIESARKRKEKELENVQNQSDLYDEFDFENRCLFCGKDASPAFEQQQKKSALSCRILVAQVKKLETQNTIFQACCTHNDDWSQQVLSRISKVDILEKNARYHYNCYTKFCHPYRAAGLRRGKQMQQTTAIAMNLIYEHIESKREDCQLSLLELKQILNNVTPPKNAIIKYHLKKKYKDCIIITSGNPWTVRFLAKSWFEKQNRNNRMEQMKVDEEQGSLSGLSDDNIDSDYEPITVPLDVEYADTVDTGNQLPKSQESYLKVYMHFLHWTKAKKFELFSEDILLAYFSEFSKKVNPSTLLDYYTKLKYALMMKHNVNLKNYGKLLTMLKKELDGNKHSKLETGSNVKKLLNPPPDRGYLDVKASEQTGKITRNISADADDISEDSECPHEEVCGACGKQIEGFRYVCVQCIDVSLCSTCELRGAHEYHYVLRVPPNRPQNEVESMVRKVRDDVRLFLLNNASTEDEPEVKIEQEELAPDPLEADNGERNNTNDDHDQESSFENLAPPDSPQSEDSLSFTPRKRSKRRKLSQKPPMNKDSEKQRADKESEFHSFGKSVLAQLEKLSEEQAVVAQEKIQSILTYGRLADIRAKQPNSALPFQNPQPFPSMLTQYSNSAMPLQNPQHSMLNQFSKSALPFQNPRPTPSMLTQYSNSAMSLQNPQHSMQNQFSKSALPFQNPRPNSSMLNQYSNSALPFQNPQHSMLNQFSKSALPFQNPQPQYSESNNPYNQSEQVAIFQLVPNKDLSAHNKVSIEITPTSHM